MSDMHVFDTIYLYDEDDRQYEAQVREVNTRAVGIRGIRSKVDTQILATIMRPKYNAGDRRFEIRNDEIVGHGYGWQWSYRPVSPIRKGALVVIRNWDRLLEARIHGVVCGRETWEHNHFAYEGVRALPAERGTGADLGRIKGHHFMASTDVEKIIKNGTGRRLLLGPCMTEKEQREFFRF